MPPKTVLKPPPDDLNHFSCVYTGLKHNSSLKRILATGHDVRGSVESPALFSVPGELQSISVVASVFRVRTKPDAACPLGRKPYTEVPFIATILTGVFSRFWILPLAFSFIHAIIKSVTLSFTRHCLIHYFIQPTFTNILYNSDTLWGREEDTREMSVMVLPWSDTASSHKWNSKPNQNKPPQEKSCKILAVVNPSKNLSREKSWKVVTEEVWCRQAFKVGTSLEQAEEGIFLIFEKLSLLR